MILNRVKLERAVIFMKYITRVVSLIFLPKTLIWNKIMFPVPTSLNLVELVENKLIRSISKKITTIPFSIRFISA